MSRTRYYICKHDDECQNGIVTVTDPSGQAKLPEENKCRRPGGPGGYWYCEYKELIDMTSEDFAERLCFMTYSQAGLEKFQQKDPYTVKRMAEKVIEFIGYKRVK